MKTLAIGVVCVLLGAALNHWSVGFRVGVCPETEQVRHWDAGYEWGVRETTRMFREKMK